MESKIAVMGDYDSICGFATLGLDVFPFESEEKAKHTFKEIANENYGIVYITEELYTMLQTEIAKFASNVTPAVIPIPSAKGSIGIGVKKAKAAVEKAIGSDIIFGK